MRAELKAPTIDHERVRSLTELAEPIVARQNAALPESELIALFNSQCHSTLEAFDFHAAWEGDGIRALVRKSLLPSPPYIPNISESELLELISHVQAHTDSPDLTWYLAVLERHIVDPHLYDLLIMQELEPEEVLRRAREYRPLITPPPESREPSGTA